jgi:hypothetical protein
MTFLFRALDCTRLPRPADREAEARKLAILRIVVGLLLAWRSGIVGRDAVYYFDPIFISGHAWPLQAIAGWMQCALACGLVLGVGPRVCASLLMLTHAAFSMWTDTYNLGPMLLVPILGSIAVLDCGRLTLIGSKRNLPSAGEYRAAYLILFLAYAGWSFQAVLYHLRDPYWVQGRTTEVMFLNSYLSEFYGIFRWWEGGSPGTLRALSIVVGSAQTLFQLAMIPLIFSRRGAAFVRTWGWVFIAGSLIDLQLTILPFVEAVLWATIFVPAGSSSRRPAAGLTSVAGTDDSNTLRYPTVAYTAGYGLLSILFFTNAILGATVGGAIPHWMSDPVLFYSGLVAPNVFNTADLTMGDHWAVLTRTDGDRPELVPFEGFEGERLTYLRSDLLYFANSLRWRREMIAVEDLATYHSLGARGYGYAYRVALYDHRRRRSGVRENYHVSVFRNFAAARAGRAVPICYTPVKVFEFSLTIDPDSSVEPSMIVPARTTDEPRAESPKPALLAAVPRR